MAMSGKQKVAVILSFVLITLFYITAIFLTFRPRIGAANYIELVAFGLTFAGGTSAFLLGYVSVVILGGKYSVGLVEFISRLNGSNHALDVKEETRANGEGIMSDASLLYIPALVSLTSLALALNIHYLDTTTDITFKSALSMLKNVLGVLDIFIKPTAMGSLTYSIEIIPVIVFFVVVAGLVPSIVLPYFYKFKVTSVNAAPFHMDILFKSFGALFGLTVVLSLVDIVYGVVTGTQPHYYSYVLPTLVGFSLHYSLGAFIGRERAQGMVLKILNSGLSKRVFKGKVVIQGSSPR